MEFEEEGRVGSVRAAKGEQLCATTGLPSRARNEASWGSGGAHVQSIATGRPRLQAIGARGALHLPLRFSAKPSPRAPWARGLLLEFWERGSPDLPACGLQRGSSEGPVQPNFISSSSRPSRGAKSRGTDDRKASSGVASSGWLARRQRDHGRGTS